MKKDKKDATRKYSYVSFSNVLIGLLIIAILTWATIYIITDLSNNYKNVNICQEAGWKGITDTDNSVFRTEWHCYNETTHESGTGITTITSGELR